MVIYEEKEDEEESDEDEEKEKVSVLYSWKSIGELVGKWGDFEFHQAIRLSLRI